MRISRISLALCAAAWTSGVSPLGGTLTAQAQDASPADATPAPADAAGGDQGIPRREATEEEIDLARQTARDGLAAYKISDYTKALTLFEKARGLYPSAQIVRMTGYSHLAVQHWAEAVEALEAALASQLGPLSEDDRNDVEDQLAKALTHFGRVTVTTSVKGATVVIDDDPPRPLPLSGPIRLPEGGHSVVVRAPGHLDAKDDIVVEGGKEEEITLDPRPTAAPPPPPPKSKPVAPPPDPGFQGVKIFPAQREIGIAAAGTGVALGAAALVTALAGADLRRTVEGDVAAHEQSYGPNCAQGDYRLCTFDRAVINNDADRADTLRDTSMWLGISGGALFAVGTTLFLLAPDGPLAKKPAHVGLRCGPLVGGVSCAGAF
ncbi:PEGA domain-containing protein [Chondromyces apiculatus]|uniref:PEGA domain-containing protein n=1 Tax=Chondromyces apiculatus DSM 436 TaxID=1192034 RepID=A0A017TD38_9BACT|nr:PEGA domain-containing protein [Chondromyces apiculatus]EYF07134.1 Hypothetical protein CAP_0613 [Chondromyces apiculatus DSM 436]